MSVIDQAIQHFNSQDSKTINVPEWNVTFLVKPLNLDEQRRLWEKSKVSEIDAIVDLIIMKCLTEDDNVTFTNFTNFTIGNYTARFLKFRVVLSSSDLASTPVVQEVTVTVDMPDRIFSENDIISGTGTFTVTLPAPYKSVNYAVGLTGENMAQGDYFTVSNKTINGFDVNFFDSSDTGISRQFDYISKGF